MNEHIIKIGKSHKRVMSLIVFHFFLLLFCLLFVWLTANAATDSPLAVVRAVLFILFLTNTLTIKVTAGLFAGQYFSSRIIGLGMFLIMFLPLINVILLAVLDLLARRKYRKHGITSKISFFGLNQHQIKYLRAITVTN